MRATWDGLPVSAAQPHGCMVVVWQWRERQSYLLLLHRAHHGPTHEGDWAWTPPSGARLPGDAVIT